MPQGFLLGQMRQKFTDSNGLPLAGGKLYAYISGTNTPQDTFSDAAMGSANTNPIVLDASGGCALFVPGATLFRFKLTDSADVVQPGYPVDGVEAIPAADAGPGAPAPVPTGGLCLFAGDTAPTGFLLADGSLVSRGTFADLFAICGVKYGAGDGTTTFALPDLRGRFPLGKADTGTGDTLGEAAGALDHTHTGPSHTHGVTAPRDGWGTPSSPNLPAVDGRMDVGNAAGVAEFSSAYQATADQALTSDAGGTGATGTANPAYLVLNFIIKT